MCVRVVKNEDFEDMTFVTSEKRIKSKKFTKSFIF